MKSPQNHGPNRSFSWALLKTEAAHFHDPEAGGELHAGAGDFRGDSPLPPKTPTNFPGDPQQRWERAGESCGG